MEYIYRMSREMFNQVKKDADISNMRVEKYITSFFGLKGKCIKVEVY